MTEPPEDVLPPAIVSAALARALPDADVSRATVAGRGWDVVAWRVPSSDGDWLLRVPRHAEGARSVEAQHCLAPVLARHGLPLPREPRLLRDAEGATLAGLYRYVEGDLAQGRGRAASARLAAEIAAFLTRLHAVAPAEVEHCRPRRYEPWRDEFAPMVERCLDRLGPRTRRWALQVGERLELASQRLPEPVLVHADLKPEHVLLDADGDIAAVLDFEGVQVSDPALDFARLLQHWGRPFALRVVAHYGHPVDADLITRAECYHAFDALAVVDNAEPFGQAELLPWAHRALRARAAADSRRRTRGADDTSD